MQEINLKCNIVGDKNVGKTSLLITYTTPNGFPKDYKPTVFGSYVEDHNIDGKLVHLGLMDTSTDPEYNHLRSLAYPQTDVFIIGFSISDPASYESVRTKWAPELAAKGPSTARLILLGMKLDLRQNRDTVDDLYNRHLAPIQYQQGLAMARDIGAERYLECSALTQEGMLAVFKEVIYLALSPRSVNPSTRRKNHPKSCIVA